jgi:hypothetical protein
MRIGVSAKREMKNTALAPHRQLEGEGSEGREGYENASICAQRIYRGWIVEHLKVRCICRGKNTLIPYRGEVQTQKRRLVVFSGRGRVNHRWITPTSGQNPAVDANPHHSATTPPSVFCTCVGSPTAPHRPPGTGSAFRLPVRAPHQICEGAPFSQA